MTDDLLQRWNATLPDQPEIGKDLLRRYAESHRRYHTADHLRHVLIMIDELADDVGQAGGGFARLPGYREAPAGGAEQRRRRARARRRTARGRAACARAPGA